MPEKITNIAKNTSYFTFALVLQKVISFTYFILIARSLLPEDLGKYYFAISFTTIFAIFIDLGLANVLTREIAKYKEKASDFLSSALAIKLPLAILSLSALVVLINLMGYPALTRQLVYLSSVCMILDSFTLTFFACSRGLHNLFFESIAAVVFQIIVMALGLAALYLKLDLRFLMLALAAASLFNFVYSACLIKYKWKIKIKRKIDLKLIKLIVKITVPFGLFAIFQRLYMYLDSVLLSILAGDKEVGLYQIAFKIIFALQFLPMAFTASLYPAFASYWAKNREQLAITFERAMSYLIIISLPISAGIIALADKIILLFKPEYGEAILPLRIIMCSLVFIFLNFPVGSLLNACDKQKINTANMGAALLLSVIMNIFLIPLYGTAGASITVVTSNFFMFILGMFRVSAIIKYNKSKIILIFFKSAVSVFVMILTALLLKHDLNIFFTVVAAGIAYLVVLFFIGGFKREDIISMYRAFAKKSI
ncbi:flippase [Patescibacteria group bacterium]|nr:flippase [Patescibacteria group bacterium]MBU4600493.1 flippase [Patescibacteria group bacterium]MCG2697527.1 flippase [Candidatus Parcubacteria bacterium]